MTDALNHNDVARAVTLSDWYARSTGRQVLVVDSNGVIVASNAKNQVDQSLLQIARSINFVEKAGISRSNAVEGSQYYAAVLLRHVIETKTTKYVVLVVSSPVKVANNRVLNEWRNLALFGIPMLIAAAFLGSSSRARWCDHFDDLGAQWTR